VLSPYKDKDKQRKFQRRWARANPHNRINRQKRISVWFSEYKKTLSCARCGISFKDYPSMCDFHHPNDLLKGRNGMANIAKKRSWYELYNELSVVIPLCANCHRQIHEEVQ
jgi:hypothetical protein